jgi:hypothetical protein
MKRNTCLLAALLLPAAFFGVSHLSSRIPESSQEESEESLARSTTTEPASTRKASSPCSEIAVFVGIQGFECG